MSTHIPFGKFKGYDAEHIAETEPSYALWMLAQYWVRDKFPAVYAIVRRGVYVRLKEQMENDASDLA
jgi:hypothetical protein